MIAACRLAGQSAQEAFDTVGALLENRYSQWDQAINCLPSWGTEVDLQVQRYVEGIQNIVQANISWRYVALPIKYALSPNGDKLTLTDPLVSAPSDILGRGR